jgi:hypothetical protein
VASAAEEYATVSEYNRHLFCQPGRLLSTRTVVLNPEWYENFCNALPFISQAEYERLLTLPRPRLKLISAVLERHFHEYEGYIKSHFGINSKQPSNEDRDRLFSKWCYEGQTYEKIARRWYEQSRTSISSGAVKKAISRSRNERKRDVWAIRILIFETGFPQLPSLICDQCFGTGEAPHQSWSLAQRQWYEKWSKVGWAKWRPTDRAPDEDFAPVVVCPKCNATGRVKVSPVSGRTRRDSR